MHDKVIQIDKQLNIVCINVMIFMQSVFNCGLRPKLSWNCSLLFRFALDKKLSQFLKSCAMLYLTNLPVFMIKFDNFFGEKQEPKLLWF